MFTYNAQGFSMKRHLILLFVALILCITADAQTQWDHWYASPEIIGAGTGAETINGFVFNDANRNGIRDGGEAGVAGVLVSNGRDWVRTDANGAYEIAVRPDMNVMIVQPSGWRVPTNERQVPQFFYVHKEAGTGYEMRFGGLTATGPAPAQINFPIIRDGAASEDFTCAIMGDPQTYSNEQLGWLRDGVVADIANAGLTQGDCIIQVGDVVGDDLGLIDRLLEITSVVGVPQWLVIGNHDIDFDAKTNEDKADTWRKMYGPHYYAFEKGNALFVMLDNVYYPCGAEDFANGRTHCEEGRRPGYNGRVDETQLQWFEALVKATPEDRLIVVGHHIPFISFVDATSLQHQTDDLKRIHDILDGREALSLSGHTHTIENHAPGQIFDGWTQSTGIGPLPFRHIIAGAASGAWYQGDFGVDGVPMALQRMGAPMGYLHLDFKGTEYVERYIGARLHPTRGQWVGLNTPDFRDWFIAITEWVRENASDRNAVPPFSANDLPDTKILTASDFAEGVWLTANVWAGSSETTVEAHLPDGTRLTLERTQQGTGEAAKIGAEWADPFATARQLSVSRYAFQSELGEERAQGQELFRGSNIGVAPPQPQRSISDRNMHLWRAKLPVLPNGVHRITVVSTDRHGSKLTDNITVEVREERPARYWRSEFWD